MSYEHKFLYATPTEKAVYETKKLFYITEPIKYMFYSDIKSEQTH